MACSSAPTRLASGPASGAGWSTEAKVLQSVAAAHAATPRQVALAFLEGLGLILSPCILPILPIMLAASLDGGKARPLGIITGFIGAFTVFALLSRQILSWLNVDPEIVRDVALGLKTAQSITILSGISVGDRLAADNLDKLRDGDRVKVLDQQ